MNERIAVVIPCYRVKAHILEVIECIGPEVERIFVVDDACPEHSGQFVQDRCTDPRVTVLHNPVNLGVGGAVMHGYREALASGMDILVKIDGDGQMDPALVTRFIQPIVMRQADYTKGNRFYDVARLRDMPVARLIGNAALSLFAKMSTGYWNIFDVNNGYTAVHALALSRVDLAKISQSYFFETDMLFRLNLLRAVVRDVPMDARYGDEISHLKILRIMPEFMLKHLRNTGKRLVYNYFLRDMTIASLQLVAGSGLFMAGLAFGGFHWVHGLLTGQATPLGTIMLGALSVLTGFQMLLAFISYDMANIPKDCVQNDLARVSPTPMPPRLP